MIQLINIREANQHLSRYIDAVQDGDEIIITRRGLPVAKLTAFAKSFELNDAQKAAKLSQQTGAPVLLFFTGSDWCGWCVRLHNEVLSTTEFKAWAKEKGIILLEVDFPRRTAQSDALKRQNAGLQQQFQIRGYPTIYIVKGDKYTKMGYEAGGPKAWIAKAESKIQL